MADRKDTVPDEILDGQWQSWIEGRTPSIDDLLRGTSYEGNADAQLDLLYNEIVVKEELGLKPCLQDYTARYPHLAQDLELHFEIHHAIHERVLTETSNRLNDKTWPQASPSVAEISLAAADPTEPLSDYELIREIGQGGMAVVYLAKHRKLHRLVALKMFQAGRFLSRRDVFRIRTEAEAMARLSHPNIIQIFDIGECKGVPFLALELAGKGTLAQKLQQLPYEAEDAARLIQTLARALHHAHERQVIHRDLKPANILFLLDGTPKVTDFGLAKVLRDNDLIASDATRTGETLGTPRYMAPEQITGHHDAVNATTDVYALGNLLYECLTGRAPFVSASTVETFQQIREHDPIPPRRLQRSVPADLETICLHCLQKDQKRRYATAVELADDLQRFLEHRPIRARAISLPERAWKWCQRRPAHTALIVIGLFVLLGSVTTIATRSYLERHRIEGLREEIAALVKEGQQSLDRDEVESAQEKFRQAWIKVQAEPALQDHQTSVSGWMDHARHIGNRSRWKQRIPPRDFDQRRDEALLASLLLFTDLHHPEQVARNAIQEAFDLTIANDLVWELEREQLLLLEVDLIESEFGPTEALKRVDEIAMIPSKQLLERRASLLDQLGRHEEAVTEREQAALYPPRQVASIFHSGMKHLREQQFSLAADEFNRVLDLEAEHFCSRLFQSICFLYLNRPAEAKVGLTACIAQRPLFSWNYYFRARASILLHDSQAAERDLLQALQGRLSETQQFVILMELGRLYLTSGRPHEAEGFFLRATDQMPDEPTGRALLAWTHFLQSSIDLFASAQYAQSQIQKHFIVELGQKFMSPIRHTCGIFAGLNYLLKPTSSATVRNSRNPEPSSQTSNADGVFEYPRNSR